MPSPAALLTRRRLLVGAGACGLGWAAGRRLPWVAAGPMRHEAYVWQRSWGEGVAGAVAGAGADFSGLVALGAEVDWTAGGPRVHRVSFDAEALRRAGTAVGLAVRVHALRGDPGEGEAGVVRAAITAARGRAEAAGLRVDEVQIDFDCAAARLDAYRRWLVGLRPAAGDARLTFTALPSWLHRPSFVGLVTAADGYVLQVHGLERAAADVTLFDRSLARRAIDRAGALGASFRVALPTYTYRVALDEQRRLAGIAAEGAAPWDDSFDVKRISAPAPEVSALVRSLAEGRPGAMAGLLWYRLPVPGDALNWTMATLRAVQRGEPVRGEVRAEVRPEAEAWSIALRNVGDADATFRGEVRVGWGQGRRLASDALGGFEERSREATGLRWRARGALSLAPGERREVGWVSVSGQAEVTANVDEEAAG